MQVRKQVITFTFIIFMLTQRILAGLSPQSETFTSNDSAKYDLETENVLYQIKKLAIESRLLELTQGEEEPAFLTEIDERLAEADNYADNQAFELAHLLLQEILDLIAYEQSSEKPISPPLVPASGPKHQPKNNTTQWEREVIAGLDFWNQKFEMNFSEEDTTLLEGSTNPVVGVRFGLIRGQPNDDHIKANAVLKKSRDYDTATGEAGLNRKIKKSTSLEIKNLVDWTHYHNEMTLSYLQNTLSTICQYRPRASLRFYLNDELRFRQYKEEHDYYASYWQNQFRFVIDAYLRATTMLGAGIRISHRNHPNYAFKDYQKLACDVNGMIPVFSRFMLRFNNELSLKKYAIQTPDTLYQSDYFQNYLDLELRFNLSNHFFVELNHYSSFLEYEKKRSYLRNYLESEFELALNYSFHLTNLLKLGYVYDCYLTQGTSNEQDVPLNTEDYFSHGITFSFDYFLSKGLILSLNDSYRIRTYPNAKDIQNFSFYSDRNINALFLLFSWDITPAYQVNLIANYDDDRARNREHNDSRNTMFSLELVYKF